MEETSLLFEHLEDPARLIVMIGVMMGLRIGEILGLRVEGLECGTLHVRRSWCRGNAGGTKNGKEREIPVPQFLGEALRDYCVQRGTTGWLFVGESGKPLSDRNLIQRHVYPVAQSLGIPHFSWHSLRHTFSHAGRKRGESSYSGDETTARTFKAEHHRSRYMHDSQVRSVRPCRKSKT